MAQVKVIKAAKGFVRGKLPFVMNGLGDVQIAEAGGQQIALRENIVGGWFHRSRTDGTGWFLTTGVKIDRSALETSLAALREKHPEVRELFLTKAVPEDLQHLPMAASGSLASADTLKAIGITGETVRFSTVNQPEADFGIDEITAGKPGEAVTYTRTQVPCRTRYVPDANVALLRVSLDNLAKAVAVRGDKGEMAEYVELDGFVRARPPDASATLPEAPEA